MTGKRSSPPLSNLRNAAEAGLAGMPRAARAAPSAEELLHELQVRQIELEMQNEALRTSLTDSTERKQLVDALTEREHYQRALLDNFPFLVWLKDENSRYLAVNRPLAESCGRASIDQVIGKTDFELWPQDLAEAYQADDQAIMASGKSRIIEELAEIGGKRVWVETYKSPVSVDELNRYAVAGPHRPHRVFS